MSGTEERIREETQKRGRIGRPPHVSLEAIVSAAIDLGFADLSMTAIGKRLHANPSSLYHYVRSRDELIAIVVDRVFATTTWPDPRPAHEWRDESLELLLGFWELTRSHVGLSDALQRVLVISDATGELLPHYWGFMQRLRAVIYAGGMSAAEAIMLGDILLGVVSSHQERTWRQEEHDAENLRGVDRNTVVGLVELLAVPSTEQITRKLAYILDGTARHY